MCWLLYGRKSMMLYALGFIKIQTHISWMINIFWGRVLSRAVSVNSWRRKKPQIETGLLHPGKPLLNLLKSLKPLQLLRSAIVKPFVGRIWSLLSPEVDVFVAVETDPKIYRPLKAGFQMISRSPSTCHKSYPYVLKTSLVNVAFLGFFPWHYCVALRLVSLFISSFDDLVLIY